MGALIMFTLVIVIANVGGFYFYFQLYVLLSCPGG